MKISSSVTFFSLILFGIGTGVCSYYTYPYILDFFYKEKKQDKKKVPYENKYYDEYDKLEEIDLDEDYVKSLKNNKIIELTPKGNVLMYYDFEKESFIYYCDTKDISYLYLETIARKYAISFNCKKIVIDIKKELEEAKKDKPKQENGKKGDSLFATLKDYNRKGTGGAKKINKKFILRQNANRYSYKGKFSEALLLQTDIYSVKKETKEIDFNSFKQNYAKKT